jgi:chromosomal replication initiation ATPase DnaA
MNLQQLPLSLAHRPALGRSDLLVSASNEEAVAWIDRWPGWPVAGLVVTGPTGAGKSHLAAVWRGRSGAQLFDPSSCEREQTARASVIDDADRLLADRGIAERVLHLYNRVASAGGTILLLGRQLARSWAIALPDLRSRVLALPAAAIERPDDELLAGLLVKLFHDRQLLISSEIVAYLLKTIERSCAAAIAAADAIDRASLAAQRPITLPLVRRAVEVS